MSEFARTLKDLADVCVKSEYQIAELSSLDPTFVRRLFDGEKHAFNLSIIRLTIALVMDPRLAHVTRGAPTGHCFAWDPVVELSQSP